MDIRKGIGVSPGFAVGEAFVLSDEEFVISRKEVAAGEVDGELSRLAKASKSAIGEIDSQLQKMSRRVGTGVAKILQAHIGLLGDESLLAEISEEVKKNRHAAEYAVSRTLKRKMKSLSDSGPAAWVQPILQDIAETERALLRGLLGDRRDDVARLPRKCVVVAHDLSPAQTLRLDRRNVLGMLTEVGGYTSHTAIVASSMGIPAVVGVENISRDITTGDLVILDGKSGTVIVNPDEATQKRYAAMERNFQVTEERLTREVSDKPAVTRCGVAVELFANIETPDEIPSALAHGAEGIGLYRTEFLYLANRFAPDEKAHVEAYRRAISMLGGRRLVIRTLDLGADKLPVGSFPVEANPYLGTRAIRLCFEKPDLFKTQLRAILKVAPLGEVHMMIPMISSVEEIVRVKEIVESVRRELRKEGEAVSDGLRLGVMVEVPSAAMTADLLADHVDFFSIGTNDLIAYTIAVDRMNERVATLYQPSHPAILRLLQHVIDVGTRKGKSVSVCGEMSSDVTYTLLLLGLGLRTFSCVPPAIPEIKKLIRSVTLADAKAVADRALSLNDPRKTAEFLRTETSKLLPDA